MEDDALNAQAWVSPLAKRILMVRNDLKSIHAVKQRGGFRRVLRPTQPPGTSPRPTRARYHPRNLGPGGPGGDRFGAGWGW